jgi:ferric-dicitrate binding protein FerR (iron transport regulator)
MRRLQKYLYNFTSQEEEKALLENPEINLAFFDAWNNYDDIKHKDIAPDTDKILKNIMVEANIPTTEKKLLIPFTKWSIAAGLIILISFGTFAFNYFYNPEVTVYAGKGQKKELTLPDGSRVWLNADTKISYRKKFNNPVREIHLTGEAFFSVVKNHKPFIVKTEKMDIKVLGTTFNIKSYPEDETCETTLVTGSVTIEQKDRPNKQITLKPQQKAILSLTDNNIQVVNTNLEKTTSWKNGNLVFDNENIDMVLNKLERWYGLKINIEQDTAVLNERYTIIIKDENIEEVIRLLQLTSPLTFSVSPLDGSSKKIYKPLQ